MSTAMSADAASLASWEPARTPPARPSASSPGPRRPSSRWAIQLPKMHVLVGATCSHYPSPDSLYAYSMADSLHFHHPRPAMALVDYH